MNRPRHPAFVMKASTLDLRSKGTGCEAQALDPEPCGFIILTLR